MNEATILSMCVQPLATAGAGRASAVSTLVFAGDFCMARGSARSADRIMAPALVDLVRGADAAVVNLEGPIEGAGEPIAKAGPHERQLAQTPGLLRDAGFGVATLANNHTMDYGAAGLAHTLRCCARAGLTFAGAGADADEARKPLSVTLPNGQPVALFSVCEREFGMAEEKRDGVAWVGDGQLAGDVGRAADTGAFVVVCAHGGVEQAPLPPVQRRAQLRRLIDAGARLVVGHHPHVPQGWERYGRGCIFYSLGDLYFNRTSGETEPGTDWGYLVRVDVTDGGAFGAHVVPYERVGDRVQPLGERRDPALAIAYLRRLAATVAGDELPARWRALACGLMRDRYEPFFRCIFPPAHATPATVGQTGRAFVKALFDGVTRPIKPVIKRLIRWPDRSSEWRALENDTQRWRELLLLLLLRCESHRWTIETAMAARGGDLSALPGDDDSLDENPVLHRVHQSGRAAA